MLDQNEFPEYFFQISGAVEEEASPPPPEPEILPVSRTERLKRWLDSVNH